MCRQRSSSSGRSATVFWGILLIAIGAWFLPQALGFPVPGMGTMWPAIPIAVGIGLYIVWLFTPDKRSSYGIAIPATINLLIGLFFFGFTTGVLPWGAMGYLWPVFPLIVGLAFLAAWVLSFFRAWGLLIPAMINSAVGIIGLAFTTAIISREYLGWAFQFWPVLLIFIGLIVLVGAFLGGATRRAPHEPQPPSGEPEQGAYLEDYGRDQGKAGASQEYKHKPA